MMRKQENPVEVSRRSGTLQNSQGTFIIKAHLNSIKDLPPIPPEIAAIMKKPIKSLGDEIRKGKTEWLFPEEVTAGEPVTITLEQIQAWFEDIDLDTVLLGFSWTFISDHYKPEGIPPFPSDWQPGIQLLQMSNQCQLEEGMERLKKWYENPQSGDEG